MSDTTTVPETPKRVVRVPIPKAKGAIEVNIDDIPQNIWDQVVLAGLKTVINAGPMAKITAKSEADESKRKAKAMECAEDRVQQMYDGTLRIGRGTTTGREGISGEVKVEARQAARKAIKAQLKRQGRKLYEFDVKDINAMADELLDTDAGQSFYEEAKAAIELRNKKTLDLSALKPSATAKAKAQRRSADRKSDVSATQAGRTTSYRPGAGR